MIAQSKKNICSAIILVDITPKMDPKGGIILIKLSIEIMN